MNFDVIIIGGGAAGISAALWCDELGLKTLLLESGAELGGQLLRVYNQIENHLGTRAANGRELRDIFVRQIETRGFAIRLQAEAAEINFEKRTIRLKSGEIFSAEFIVLASGVRRGKLNIEGEEEFQNKGIIESGKRELDSVKDKIVGIIGGGDAAFENALILAETAARVFLVARGASFRAREEFVERVFENPKIKVLTDAIATKIIGSENVEAMELVNLKTKENFRLSVGAILIRVGVEPNTEILGGKIDLDAQGYIKIDSLGETSVGGVFAVGDVANRTAPTVSGAVGMGAIAAKAIYSKISPKKYFA